LIASLDNFKIIVSPPLAGAEIAFKYILSGGDHRRLDDGHIVRKALVLGNDSMLKPIVETL
jgi:hypothetical protein